MAAPRRRECCLPDGETLRLPPLDAKSLPNRPMIFKAKMHDDVVKMFSGTSTFRFDDSSLSTGVLKLQGESYAFEALPAAALPGNPMDLLFSIENNSNIKLAGKITNSFTVDRLKMNPNARRRPSLKKRSALAVGDDSMNGDSSAANGSKDASSAPKRQRVSGLVNGSLSGMRSSKPGTRPPSALNGIGTSPYPSPRVSPGQTGANGNRAKSRSSTPPGVSNGSQSQSNYARSLPSSTRASPAKSISPGSGTSTGSRGMSAEREKKLRYGIIQLLALDDTPVGDLRKRLCDPRETPIGERPFLNIVRKVSKHSKNGYVLKEECWSEVDVSCALYSEADRKRIREVLANRNKSSIGGIVRGPRGTKRAYDPPMIVDDKSSHKIISQALDRFDNRPRKMAKIRTAKEEADARSLFRAYHSVYEQVNKRMDDVRKKMSHFHTQYNDASSPREQSKIAENIQNFYTETIDRHSEYTKYLPQLHRELKAILNRLENYTT